jgi:hypothetical protein
VSSTAGVPEAFVGSLRGEIGPSQRRGTLSKGDARRRAPRARPVTTALGRRRRRARPGAAASGSAAWAEASFRSVGEWRRPGASAGGVRDARHGLRRPAAASGSGVVRGQVRAASGSGVQERPR